MTRADGRQVDELRPVTLTPGFISSATGSVLIEAGNTRVICTAMVEESVPPWMRGRGTGWVTAEYGMLPGSTDSRKPRDASRGKQDGRTVEIQRLIGRSLRSVVDFAALGERTAWIDCDVIQADGGTRCAAICGGYVALHLALSGLVDKGLLRALPLTDSVAAVSVGIVDGEPLLDLAYVEDSRAEVDMNVVMSGEGKLIEVQATAEKTPFGRASLDDLLGLAAGGISALSGSQAIAIARGVSRVRAVLASHNSHKAVELTRLLPGFEIEVFEGELPEETGTTFRENALLKARHVSAQVPGVWVIADDSGIAAEALGGAPGVYSARYAGEDATDEANLQKLMDALADVDDRRVAYVAELVTIDPSGAEIFGRGELRGTLAFERAGDGGFGYDPAFVPEGETRTAAQLAPAEKDAISHRGRAASALAEAIAAHTDQ